MQSSKTKPSSLVKTESWANGADEAGDKGAAVGKGSKRERVVIAAAKLFLEEGYGTTGMDAIAKEADVSKATVYSYYEDKASLFADVMLRLCDEMGGHDVEGLVADTPEATLKAVAVLAVQRLLESVDRAILQRVVAESKEFPELGKRFWADRSREVGSVRGGLSRGRTPRGPPRSQGSRRCSGALRGARDRHLFAADARRDPQPPVRARTAP